MNLFFNKKRFSFVCIIAVSVFLSACKIPVSIVEQPVKDFLKSEFNIKDDFKVLAAVNDGEAGFYNYAYLELTKPYRTYLSLAIDRETNLVDPKNSDQVYLELFKGVYIEEKPEVIQVIKQIIKKYGLVKYPEKFVIEDETPAYMFPYDNIELNIYSQALIEDFKKNQKIDIDALLPKLKPSDPRRENYNSRYIGVVNFLFEFDVNKNNHSIPKAKDLIVEFQKSGVLTKGIYSIDMFNNVALFEVDENGKYTIIATPTYDELDNSYFYGDYAAKKID